MAIMAISSSRRHPVRLWGSSPRRCARCLASRSTRSASSAPDLNYEKFVDEGEKRLSTGEEYNSHNTHQLDVEGMKQLLMKLPFIVRLVNGEDAEMELLG